MTFGRKFKASIFRSDKQAHANVQIVQCCLKMSVVGKAMYTIWWKHLAGSNWTPDIMLNVLQMVEIVSVRYSARHRLYRTWQHYRGPRGSSGRLNRTWINYEIEHTQRYISPHTLLEIFNTTAYNIFTTHILHQPLWATPQWALRLIFTNCLPRTDSDGLFSRTRRSRPL